MLLTRVPRTASVVVTHTFYVDETPTDAAGNVTATLKRLDGTLVNSATATHPDLGTYAYTVPSQAQFDSLTLDWSGTVAGAAVTERDYVEIVGGFLFGLVEARNRPPTLSADTYPTAMLVARRIEVEQECERICRRAFVPRFMRIALPGSGRPELLTPHTDLRALRAVTIDGVVLSAPEVAAIGVSASGVLTRPGGGIWPYASAIYGSLTPNVIVEYEYGRDFPPEDIRTAAIIRLRSRLTLTDSGVPYQAISFTVADGGVYRMSTPARDRTGIPEVDAAYGGYSIDPGGFA